jgi:hypothetical protein
VVTGDWIDPGYACASQSRRDMMVSREEEKERMTYVPFSVDWPAHKWQTGRGSIHPPARARCLGAPSHVPPRTARAIDLSWCTYVYVDVGPPGSGTHALDRCCWIRFRHAVMYDACQIPSLRYAHLSSLSPMHVAVLVFMTQCEGVRMVVQQICRGPAEPSNLLTS